MKQFDPSEPTGCPFLLVGDAFVGLAARARLLPLANPLYYLCGPKAASRYFSPLPQTIPLPVGMAYHERMLNQWQEALLEWSGHPGRAFAHFKAGLEDSWRELKRHIKGEDDTGLSSGERDMLLFLLQSRLDESKEEQRGMEEAYQAAVAKLNHNLNVDGASGDALTFVPEDAEDNLRKLRIWGKVACRMDLPRAMWAWPFTLFAAWRATWPGEYAGLVPLCRLHWPVLWEEKSAEEARVLLHAFGEHSGGCEKSASFLESQWNNRFTGTGQSAVIYQLPAGLMRDIMGNNSRHSVLGLVWGG